MNHCFPQIQYLFNYSQQAMVYPFSVMDQPNYEIFGVLSSALTASVSSYSKILRQEKTKQSLKKEKIQVIEIQEDEFKQSVEVLEDQKQFSKSAIASEEFQKQKNLIEKQTKQNKANQSHSTFSVEQSVQLEGSSPKICQKEIILVPDDYQSPVQLPNFGMSANELLDKKNELLTRKVSDWGLFQLEKTRNKQIKSRQVRMLFN